MSAMYGQDRIRPDHDQPWSAPRSLICPDMGRRQRGVQPVDRVHQRGSRALQYAQLSVKRSYGVSGAVLHSSAQEAGPQHHRPHQHKNE
jgi:hypothetical protein